MKKLLRFFLCICAGVLLLSVPAVSQEVPDLLDELKNLEPYSFLNGIGEESADSNRLNTLGFYAYQEGDLLRGELTVDYDEFGFIRYFYLTIEGKSYSSTPDFSA